MRLITLRPLVNQRRSPIYLRLILNEDPRLLAQQNLDQMLTFAAQHDYYRPLLKNGLLKSLPVLTKQQIRTFFDRLRTPHRESMRPYINASGGSTGEPTLVVQDREYADWNEATENYFYREFLGIDPQRERKVILWGAPRDLAKSRSLKVRLGRWGTSTKWLNSYHVSPKRWAEYIDAINRYRPVVLKGYAGSLWQLARFAKRNNIRLFSPRYIYSSSETLYDSMRRDIEEAFQTKVYDFYGSREVGPIAAECRAGRKHIFIFNNLLEIVDINSNKPLKPGMIGRLLVTNLHNYSMPLLRYDIGDAGSMDDTPCPCGSKLPCLSNLQGRICDYLDGQDGKMVYACHFVMLMTEFAWVQQFRIEQSGLNCINISVVPSYQPPARDLYMIAEEFKNMLGSDCSVTWKLVDAIPTVGQGKYAHVRNLLHLAG